MSDTLTILLRPITYKQQPGWVKSTCPLCGGPCWDTGMKLEGVRMCDGCSLKPARKSEQTMLEV